MSQRASILHHVGGTGSGARAPHRGAGSNGEPTSASAMPPEPLSEAQQFRSALVFACNLFDKVDDVPPELSVFDPHERLGQRKSIGRGEEVGHVGRRGRLAESLGLSRLMRRALE